MTTIEEIEQRLQNITPGGWGLQCDLHGDIVGVGSDGFSIVEIVEHRKEADDNAIFIANAPTDIKFLLNHTQGLETQNIKAEGNVKALTTTLKMAKDALQAVHDNIDWRVQDASDMILLCIAHIDLTLGENK